MSFTKTIFINFTLNTSAVADYYRALANEFVHRGYKVVIITDGKRTHKVSENTNPAIFTWPSKRPTRLADARFLVKLIKRFRPVLIFSNFGADNISIFVSWLMKVPLRFVTYHTMLDPEVVKKPNQAAIIFQFFRKRIIFRLTTMVLPVAAALKQELSEVYRVPDERIRVFHNAIGAQPELVDNETSYPPHLISAGGLSRGKGHDVLINAMAAVIKKHPDVKLSIYGEGPERAALESLIHKLQLEQNVELPGKISHEAVLNALSQAYALIHPSRFEAFGYSVLEAISVGTPVIASAVGGIPEIIREGKDGFLVPVDEPVILAERICYLLNNNEVRNSMSRNCYRRFEETFELNHAVQKQVDWFESEIFQLLHRNTIV